MANKIDLLRRYIFSCFSPSATATSSTTTTKKRLSTSLRDDRPDPTTISATNQDPQDQDSNNSTEPTTPISASAAAASFPPPRPSKSMVIGTLFGSRHGHVWLCFQNDRISTKPLLLLELSVATHRLVKEMQCGLVRVALESAARPDLKSCPLRSIPVWTAFCNGKRVGFALRRKASNQIRLMLKTMQSTTVGAGVIPAGIGTGSEEIMYMRANYEHVVGSADSESFHLINPDEGSGQELGVFLMRSSK